MGRQQLGLFIISCTLNCSVSGTFSVAWHSVAELLYHMFIARDGYRLVWRPHPLCSFVPGGALYGCCNMLQHVYIWVMVCISEP